MHILRSNHLIGIYTRFICIGNDMRFLVLPCAVNPAPAEPGHDVTNIASQRWWILMLHLSLSVSLSLSFYLSLFRTRMWQFQKQRMQRSVKLTSKSWWTSVFVLTVSRLGTEFSSPPTHAAHPSSFNVKDWCVLSVFVGFSLCSSSVDDCSQTHDIVTNAETHEVSAVFKHESRRLSVRY